MNRLGILLAACFCVATISCATGSYVIDELETDDSDDTDGTDSDSDTRDTSDTGDDSEDTDSSSATGEDTGSDGTDSGDTGTETEDTGEDTEIDTACMPTGCETPTQENIPYIVDGLLDGCLVFDDLGAANLNMWGADTTVVINDSQTFSAYTSNGQFPGSCNGKYYVLVSITDTNGHVEFK